MQNDIAGQEQELHEKGLAFFGAITASVSHELNNVISIIDQTAGLLQDLLIGAQHGRPISEERLQRMADNVRNQTERGIGIIKRFNTFGHSADDPVREFELNSLIENLTELNQRFALMKKTSLDFQPADEPLSITNSPFLLQQLLFLCIRRFLSFSQPEDSVFISLRPDEADVHLKVEGSSINYDDAEREFVYLEILMNRMKGSIELSQDTDKSVFDITIPRRSV